MSDAGANSPSHVIGEGRTTVGNGHHADVSLINDAMVSHNHCVFFSRSVKGNNWIAVRRDSGSTHGTVVNGEDIGIGEVAVLKSGDYLTLGGTTFKLLPLTPANLRWDPSGADDESTTGTELELEHDTPFDGGRDSGPAPLSIPGGMNDWVDRYVDRYNRVVEQQNRLIESLYSEFCGAFELPDRVDPAPSGTLTTGQTPQRSADIYVTRADDGYRVCLNGDGGWQLRLSRLHPEQIETSDGCLRKKDLLHLQTQLLRAVLVIDAILARQRPVQEVTESLVRFQREFLDNGVEHLRPLILRDVADAIGWHKAIVRRVLTNKYVHTPQGTFELKYFFNSPIEADGGADLAGESVKQRIKKIIGEESSDKPLSDEKIRQMLADEGLEIRRRTVAKYREIQKIPPSSRRKKLE